MKVFLVYPPPWTPAMPYLALPVLTGFLRSHGVDVIQRDLNLETYDTVLSRRYLEEALGRLRSDYPQKRNRALPEKVEWAFAEGPRLAVAYRVLESRLSQPGILRRRKEPGSVFGRHGLA